MSSHSITLIFLTTTVNNRNAQCHIFIIFSGCNLQVDVKHIDDDGIHHVLLFATISDTMVLSHAFSHSYCHH